MLLAALAFKTRLHVDLVFIMNQNKRCRLSSPNTNAWCASSKSLCSVSGIKCAARLLYSDRKVAFTC